MAKLLIPGVDPDADALFRKAHGLGPDDPAPVSLESYTVPEDQARQLEMQRESRSVRRIAPAPKGNGERVPPSTPVRESISAASSGKSSFLDGKFACLGGNLGLAAGGCYGDGQPYLYSGLAWPPGVDIMVGHAPGGVEGYLKGWSASADGLPGAGMSITDGHPSANAWTAGTPGVNATYGMSLRDIADRFRNAAANASKGIYNMMGRPYDDPHDQ